MFKLNWRALTHHSTSLKPPFTLRLYPPKISLRMAGTHALQAAQLFSVKDHVCLVTGGATGIGLMATQALAANGAKVYITGRRAEALDNAAAAHNPSASTGSGQIIPLGPCDVTSKADLEALAADLEQREGRLDLLVASAGVSGPRGKPDEAHAPALKEKLWGAEDFEQWGAVFNTNVSAVYFTTVAMLPLLQAASKRRESLAASVIVISSMSGLMHDSQGHFSYNAAKGATVHLAKLMSAEFARAGVRVNSIAPGYFPSEMTAQESDDRQKSHLPAEKIREKGHVPAQRPGHDEEMAQAVLFLTRNRYVNGEIVAVDGGTLVAGGGGGT